jgi:hypothetical protein
LTKSLVSVSDQISGSDSLPGLIRIRRLRGIFSISDSVSEPDRGGCSVSLVPNHSALTFRTYPILSPELDFDCPVIDEASSQAIAELSDHNEEQYCGVVHWLLICFLVI